MLFDLFDVKKSGSLDFMEFQMMMAKLDIIVKSDDCYCLFRRYAHDDLRIRYLHFLYVQPR
jgi:Ca2+-binding EF-hand superfamily protein